MNFTQFLREATASKGKTPAEKKKEAQEADNHVAITFGRFNPCLLYTSPSPRDKRQSRMPSSA